MASIAAVSCAVSSVAYAQAKSFDVQAQSAETGVAEFARQADVQILISGSAAKGRRTNAVHGNYDVPQALEILLKGTGLYAQLTGPGAYSLLTTTAKAAKPTGEAEPAPALDNSALSEVVVTGVRGRPRTIVNSPTPIDVLTGSDLEASGHTGLYQALETLVPSFNLPFRAGGGTATVIATGGLRGLNPDQTLILVNGKRRHKTSLINAVSSLYIGSVPVDLDLIPESSIERVEVLRDGAAAQYGSDAIAGVVNIILKNSDGGSISATTGQNFDRGDGQFANTEGSYGAKLGANGHLDLFFNTKSQADSNRALPVAPSVVLYPPINNQTNPENLTADRLITKNYGVLPSETLNLGFNGYDDLNSDTQFYSNGTYSYRESYLPYTVRTADSNTALPQVYPDGFRPDLAIYENDMQVTFGVTGKLADWSWDLSTTYGLNHAREDLTQSINASLGPTSPTAFYVGTLDSSEWDNSLDITRDFKLGDTSDVQVSFGLQHRLETYGIEAGDPASYAAGTYVIPAGQPFAGQRPATGAQAVPGIQPADASYHTRDNYAGYAEFGYTPVKKLFLDAAVRYEDYSDASGSAVVGKFDGRYEVTDWLTFRGAISNGFRAPALAQEYYSSTSSQFQLVNNALQLLLIKTLPVDSAQAKALGAQPLRPETSRNYSAGFALTPLHNLSITVDAYKIDVDKRIALTSTLTGTAVSNILVANGLSGALSAQYFTNAINTETQGIDLVASYKLNLQKYGAFRWSLGANYNETTITHVNANPPQLAALGPSYVLFDAASRGYLTAALPKTKVAIDTNYTVGKWELVYRETRYGGYEIIQDTASSDRSFGPKWITDLEIDYHFTKSLTGALGSNNIGNVYPSANGIYNAAIGSGQYPGTSPFGFTGGFYYARVKYTF
jgi:iron complex outermembrane receptor protein